MNTNVNLAAPAGALALVGTGFVLFVAAIFLIQSLIVKKRRRAKIVLVLHKKAGFQIDLPATPPTRGTEPLAVAGG